ATLLKGPNRPLDFRYVSSIEQKAIRLQLLSRLERNLRTSLLKSYQQSRCRIAGKLWLFRDQQSFLAVYRISGAEPFVVHESQVGVTEGRRFLFDVHIDPEFVAEDE